MTSREILPYRQGRCFSIKDIPSLMEKFAAQNINLSEDCILILLTHSCALASKDYSKEPFAEAILAHRIKKPSSMYRDRKNPRKLHVQVMNDGTSIWVELNIAERIFFERSVLEALPASPDFHLTTAEIEVLQRWLVARYAAPAFPEVFMKRFGKAKSAIEKLMAQDDISTLVTSMWIRMEPFEDELPDEVPYHAEFVIMARPNLSSSQEAACKKLLEAVKLSLEEIGEKSLVLEGTKVSLISEDHILISEMKNFVLLQFDYLSEGNPDTELPITKK